MFREVLESEIGPFLDLLGEVEGGNHYHPSDLRHVEWITDRVRRQYARGGRFYAMYEESGTPLGIGCLLTEPQLHTDYHRSELLSQGTYPEYRGQGHGTALLGYIEE